MLRQQTWRFNQFVFVCRCVYLALSARTWVLSFRFVGHDALHALVPEEASCNFYHARLVHHACLTVVCQCVAFAFTVSATDGFSREVWRSLFFSTSLWSSWLAVIVVLWLRRCWLVGKILRRSSCAIDISARKALHGLHSFVTVPVGVILTCDDRLLRSHRHRFRRQKPKLMTHVGRSTHR